MLVIEPLREHGLRRAIGAAREPLRTPNQGTVCRFMASASSIETSAGSDFINQYFGADFGVDFGAALVAGLLAGLGKGIHRLLLGGDKRDGAARPLAMMER